MKTDFEFLIKELPNYFITNKITARGEWHCRSNTGIISETIWKVFFDRVRSRWGKRFMEVYHQVCSNHVDFIIYLKQE